MLFIIEGTDRVGKTSLCERLLDTLGGEIIHFSAPQSTNAVDEYVTPLTSYVPGTGQNVFVDRHYLGELVWAPFFDRDPIVDDHDAWLIEQHLKALGAITVFATRDEAELEAASVDEPTVGRAVEAQRLFGREVGASRSRSDTYWRPYTHGDGVTRLIIAGRELEDEAAPMHRFSSNWIGDPYADVLVVTSAEDTDVDGPHVREFCERHGQAPAVCQIEAGPRYSNVHGLWHAMGRPRVAAYGGESAHKLIDIGMGLYAR